VSFQLGTFFNWFDLLLFRITSAHVLTFATDSPIRACKSFKMYDTGGVFFRLV